MCCMNPVKGFIWAGLKLICFGLAFLKYVPLKCVECLSYLENICNKRLYDGSNRNTSNRDVDEKLQKLQHENTLLQKRLQEAIGKKSKLEMEKNYALNRLSDLMGDKLRKNNPAITNLNDPNRPMKLGDQFSELYENEWTDAFTDIGSTKNLSERGGMLEDQERRIIEDLLDILQEIWKNCKRDVEEQLSNTKKDMNNDARRNTSILLKDTLKSKAAQYIPHLARKIIIDGDCKIIKTYKDLCTAYINKCVQICYYSELQDPPMFLNFEPGEDFNSMCFKHYTKSGTKVDYLVWPAFHLHEDGPLLTKGVVQPK